jgi:leucyl/phenylalanyl-tRNA---protein transferase
MRRKIIPPEVLLEAYARGCFPMADPDTGDLGWYTADPRAILPLDPFHVPRRVQRFLKTAPFRCTRDAAFEEVVRGCSQRESSWIDTVIRNSYVNLHHLGFAHSVEVWNEERLVGGLYGVHLGSAYFGESMFYRESGASKAALVHLAGHLNARGFRMLEIQMITPLTAQFGAVHVHRRDYARLLKEALETDCTWEGVER